MMEPGGHQPQSDRQPGLGDWQVIGTNNRLTNDTTFPYAYDDERTRLTPFRKNGTAADDGGCSFYATVLLFK